MCPEVTNGEGYHQLFATLRGMQEKMTMVIEVVDCHTLVWIYLQ